MRDLMRAAIAASFIVASVAALGAGCLENGGMADPGTADADVAGTEGPLIFRVTPQPPNASRDFVIRLELAPLASDAERLHLVYTAFFSNGGGGLSNGDRNVTATLLARQLEPGSFVAYRAGFTPRIGGSAERTFMEARTAAVPPQQGIAPDVRVTIDPESPSVNDSSVTVFVRVLNASSPEVELHHHHFHRGFVGSGSGMFDDVRDNGTLFVKTIPLERFLTDNEVPPGPTDVFFAAAARDGAGAAVGYGDLHVRMEIP